MDLFSATCLPVVPDAILRRHSVAETGDTRFRAAARLRQALWREGRGLPIGGYRTARGRRRRLGSRLAQESTERGENFVTAAVHRLARRELAYREPGAAIDEERLFSNLLSSMPLAFNLFGPLKLDGTKADRFTEKLCPDIAGRVSTIQFEHSPGRGDPAFTDDGTAFDVFISMRRADGAKTFVAIEVKYAEALTEPEARHRPRYDDLSASCGLFVEPMAPALRRNPLQQFWRKHMLAQTLIDTGLYDAGCFAVIAPRLNADVQRGAAVYERHLARETGGATFQNIELEAAIGWLADAGAAEEAAALSARYTDFTAVHSLI